MVHRYHLHSFLTDYLLQIRMCFCKMLHTLADLLEKIVYLLQFHRNDHYSFHNDIYINLTFYL